MIRFAILLILLTAGAVQASAAVYGCRQPDGTLFLTDDRDNFPAGCEPEGTLDLPPPPAPADPGSRQPGAPSEPPSAPPAEAGAAQDQPPPEPPAATAPLPRASSPMTEPPPAGSAGIPPGLNPQEDLDERADEIPGVDEPPPVGPRLDPWMQEAQALFREYRETRVPPPATVEEEMETAERLREIEGRIAAFLDQLERSGLSPGEQDAVERELPIIE